MWQKWFGPRAAREKWEAGLSWFRLRYQDSSRATRCLNLLSRAQACGRISLSFQPGTEVSQLFLGAPANYIRLVQQMTADFGISLVPAPTGFSCSPPQRLTSTSQLPWERPFQAQLVAEGMYVSGQEARGGSFFPQVTAHRPSDWNLPLTAPLGLALQPYWPDPPRRSTSFNRKTLAASGWPLGRLDNGQLVQISGQINIYGRQQRVSAWLVPLLLHQLAENPAKLVVIDGAGDLVTQLKRKAVVTRLLGEQLTYMDMDAASLIGGYNPLAGLPEEDSDALVARWQQWFRGMHVHSQGLALLADARQDGVGDIPGLRRWLKQKERQGNQAAVASLGQALNRLLASRTVRTWLEWPTNPFQNMAHGALLVSCHASGWAQKQILQALLLAAMQPNDLRIVVHGLPWKNMAKETLNRSHQVVISNGPPLPDAATILVGTDSSQNKRLVDRFLGGDALLAENLALLGREAGILITHDSIVPVSWHTETGKVGKKTHESSSNYCS